MRTLSKIWICIFLFFPVLQSAEGKKIKNSFKIEKSDKTKSKSQMSGFPGKEISFIDTLSNRQDLKELEKCGFAGYEKEAHSNKESFILINGSDKTILAFKLRIDYLDIKDRMLHAREVQQMCVVPPGETRRFDIKSWDTQHTYYYYLGNEPKKVAIPYKVSISPISLWIDE